MAEPRLRPVVLTVDGAVHGDLAVAPGANGIVVFAHGSGSGRSSPRNRRVAAALQRAGLATLLFDLLTPLEEERDERTRELRFDIPLLAARLRGVRTWIGTRPELAPLALGYFGASTGAAAALVAASGDPVVRAIVSRGGRPDLAGAEVLRDVQAPTLLIVGGLDTEVIEMNRWALGHLGATEKELVIVPGASHLFEEPGKLDEVARLAADWFTKHLAG